VADKPLTQVGWYCWRCQGINEQPCRSDAVPIYVSEEWVEDMRKEIADRG
jgi:hypothetical protein